MQKSTNVQISNWETEGFAVIIRHFDTRRGHQVRKTSHGTRQSLLSCLTDQPKQPNVQQHQDRAKQKTRSSVNFSPCQKTLPKQTATT
ncbi:MAG TPA: hypothetical protein VJK52_02875 [Candidatus Nanoarchaeia archaeon]|nr:hypothetical protein [Candidatus Nanoarchaeia archaeon]